MESVAPLLQGNVGHWEPRARSWPFAGCGGVHPCVARTEFPSDGDGNGTTVPISSGLGIKTRFAVENETIRTIQIFLDGKDVPIEIRGVRTYTDELEVGSTHIIKAVVNGRVFQKEFTVPRVMRRLVVSSGGIREWSLSN